MMIYIFKRLEKVSDRYHCSGGLVIIASTVEHAKQLIAEYNESRGEWSYYNEPEIVIEDSDWESVYAIPVHPDFEPVPEIFVFPDAGCC